MAVYEQIDTRPLCNAQTNAGSYSGGTITQYGAISDILTPANPYSSYSMRSISTDNSNVWVGLEFTGATGVVYSKQAMAKVEVDQGNLMVSGGTIEGKSGIAQTIYVEGSNDTAADWDSKSWTAVATITADYTSGAVATFSEVYYKYWRFKAAPNDTGIVYTDDTFSAWGSGYLFWAVNSIKMYIDDSGGLTVYETFGANTTDDHIITVEMASIVGTASYQSTNYENTGEMGNGFDGTITSKYFPYQTLLKFEGLNTLVGSGITVLQSGIRVFPSIATVAGGLYDARIRSHRILQDWNADEVTYLQRKTGVSWNGTTMLPGWGAVTDDGSFDYNLQYESEDAVSRWLSLPAAVTLNASDLIAGWFSGEFKEYGVLLLHHWPSDPGNRIALIAPNGTDGQRPYIFARYLIPAVNETIVFGDTWVAAGSGPTMSESIEFSDAWLAYIENEGDIEEQLILSDAWAVGKEYARSFSDTLELNDFFEAEKVDPPDDYYQSIPGKIVTRTASRGSKDTEFKGKLEHGRKPYMTSTGSGKYKDRRGSDDYRSMMDRPPQHGLYQAEVERHSEFKKPYDYDDYEGMEHFYHGPFGNFPLQPDMYEFMEDRNAIAIDADGISKAGPCVITCFQPQYCGDPIRCHLARQNTPAGEAILENPLLAIASVDVRRRDLKVTGEYDRVVIDNSKVYPILIYPASDGWTSFPDEPQSKITAEYKDAIGMYCAVTIPIVCKSCAEANYNDLEADSDYTDNIAASVTDQALAVYKGLPPVTWTITHGANSSGITFSGNGSTKITTDGRITYLDSAASASGAFKVTATDFCGSSVEYTLRITNNSQFNGCHSRGVGGGCTPCGIGQNQTFYEYDRATPQAGRADIQWGITCCTGYTCWYNDMANADCDNRYDEGKCAFRWQGTPAGGTG